MKVKNAADLDDVLEDFGGETIAVRTRIGDLFLMFDTEDGGSCYQGVPFAEDEAGRKVNRNSGLVKDLSDLCWPMTLLTPYGPREKHWKARRIEFASRTTKRQPYPNE